MNRPAADCELCHSEGGTLLWQNETCRVVAVDEPDYPGFARVIARRHVREVTDLAPDESAEILRVVLEVERALRELLEPDKMNLASLGNMTPHVHWHVIPRFRDDRHFPGPVWAASRREPAVPEARRVAAAGLAKALRARLGPGA